MDNKYRSRRFLLALMALLIGSVGMLIGRDVGGFALLASAVLGGYGFTRSPLGGGRGRGEL